MQGAYFDRLRSVVESFGGTVEKFAGDAVVAVFGVPHVHEDDAERAVRAALGIGDALAGLNDTLGPRFGIALAVRTGIATGEAVVAGNEALATGDVMNTAARLEQGAEAGEVLVDRETMSLTRAVVEYEETAPVVAKGKAEAVPVWRAVGVSRERRRPLPRLVGRSRELEVLAETLERAIAGDAPRMVVVLGEPGIGKSRLLEEFAGRVVGRARVYRGAAAAYGEGTAWLPFAGVVLADAGIVPSEEPAEALAKLGAALVRRHPPDEASLLEAQLRPLVTTVGDVASAAELLWAVRRYLEGLAREQPAAIVLDDLHWAPAMLLDTLAELIETIASVPLVLFLAGRPELRERVGALLTGEAVSVLTLDALAPDAAGELAVELNVEPALAERAEGNPLFLEELAAAAGEGAVMDVPRSVQALVSARVDLLPDGAKLAVQAGSVVGTTFWDGVLGALVDGQVDAASLHLLRARRFVNEDLESAFLGQRQFRFHHALIRDVAYGSVAKRERSTWHRLAARWLMERREDRPEVAVSVAHHLDRALALAREVAPLEEPDPELVEAAADALLHAGEWARRQATLEESIHLHRRAVEVAARTVGLEDRAKARLAHVLAIVGHADEAAVLAAEVLDGSPGGEPGAFAALALAQVAYGRGEREVIREHAETAIELAREASLAAVQAEALHVLGWAELWLGAFAEAEETWGETAEVALRAGDLVLAAGASSSRAISAAISLRLDDAERWSSEAMTLAEASGSMRSLESAHLARARTLEFQGRLAEAAAHGRESMRFAAEIGDRFSVTSSAAFGVAGPLLRLGDVEGAWEALEEGLQTALDLGGSAYLPNLRFGRAEVLLARGRLEEAERELEEVGPVDAFDAQQLALTRARILTAQGRHDQAAREWQDALAERSGVTEAVQIDAELGFAGFLIERGRREEAERLLAEVRATLAGTGAEVFEGPLRELEARLT